VLRDRKDRIRWWTKSRLGARKREGDSFDTLHIFRPDGGARTCRIKKDDPRVSTNELDGLEFLGWAMPGVILTVNNPEDAHVSPLLA
jgi:hypothetical protein